MQKGSSLSQWFQATSLAGTFSFGSAGDDNLEWELPFQHAPFSKFLINSGYFNHWLIVTKENILNPQTNIDGESEVTIESNSLGADNFTSTIKGSASELWLKSWKLFGLSSDTVSLDVPK